MPPGPARHGLGAAAVPRRSAACYGMPTVVNNVETLCNMPFVAARGADAYRALSPDAETPGSKLVCFNERFARPGVYEVPFGISLRELCEEVAGGLRDGRAIKALQIGGPLGGILPAALLDTPFDFDPLAAEGCMVGHGGILAFDDRPTCATSPATCCASARTRAAASASRAGSACGARTRCSPPSDAVDRDAAGGAAGDARARLAVRARRRHAGADPLAADALPRGAGAGVMRASPSTASRSRSPPGATVLDAARAAGRWVPTLCFDERQAPFGACRVCLVGVEGAPAPLPACTTPCRDGMAIDTADATARRVAARGRRAGAVRAARAAGAAHRAGAGGGAARRRRAALAGRDARAAPATRATPTSRFRHELCISCGRCVRACDEVQGTFALTATGRGFEANVAAGLDQGFRESACVSCGACADTCPTEAITEISLLTRSGPARR